MPHATPEARRALAYARIYVARLPALGRCTTCRGGPVELGHVLCDDYRYAQRLDRYDHYERTRLQGVRQPPARRHPLPAAGLSRAVDDGCAAPMKGRKP